MNDFLTTQELIKRIEHSRDSHQVMSEIELEKNAKMRKIFKIIYWGFVAFFILHLIYMAIPLFLDTEALVSLKGSQIEVIAKTGQTPPTLELTVVEIDEFHFEDLEVGDLVVVFNDVDAYYMEKAVLSIDEVNETFIASYAGITSDTYDEDTLVGIYSQDANFFQLIQYGMNSLRGFIGTALVYILVSTIVYYLAFKKPEFNEEDSDI